MHISSLWSLLAIGGIGGFLSGLLGVGGGIIFVPALYFYFTSSGIDPAAAVHISVGTSLALVLGSGASSSFWHYKKGSIDFPVIKKWGPAVVAGVVAGTFFASAVNGDILRKIFAGIAMLIAFYMAFSREPHQEEHHRRVPVNLQRFVAALIGLLSALIGVGGAMLTIPFMTYNGIPMRRAVGTGGALGCVIALPAMAGYMLSGLAQAEVLPPYSIGYVNVLATVMILPVAMLLSPVGVHMSHTLSRNFLRRIFAVVLVVVSIRMFMA